MARKVAIRRLGDNVRLTGKTVLITGASRNIGKCMALAFAKEGADLVLNTKSNREELDAVTRECQDLGARVHSVIGDVSVADQAQKVVEAGLKHFGKIDVLISNAAIRPHTPILDVSIEEWHQVLAVNLHATFYLCKAVLPSMVKRHSGNIIALGGGYAPNMGLPNTAAVSASKLGLEGLIRVVATEMGPHGIRANLLMAGSTDTERRHPEWYPERRESGWTAPENLSRTPLRRQGKPEEVAAACLFLACDESSYVTGSHLWCNGGVYSG